MLYALYEYDKCLFKEEWCVRDKIKHRSTSLKSMSYCDAYLETIKFPLKSNEWILCKINTAKQLIFVSHWENVARAPIGTTYAQDPLLSFLLEGKTS